MERVRAVKTDGGGGILAGAGYTPDAESRPRAGRRLGAWAAASAGVATVLGLELVGVLVATGGRLVYSIEAPYTELALATQIAQGHYGLVPGEAAAPSSSILFPILLAPFTRIGLGAVAAAGINIASTLASCLIALLLAEECGIPLRKIAPLRLFVLSASVTLALNLAGLAMTGLEHSLHVALTTIYLLGLVRFVRRGRCDWWWFACIVVQPMLRFEAAGMLVADVLIFLGFRRYRYAAITVLIGMGLVVGYCLFLYSLGLPLLPSSVLARSDWSNAAVGTHDGMIAVLISIVRNFRDNLESFGAPQILLGVGIAVLWLRTAAERRAAGILCDNDRVGLMTVFFMGFVSIAQLIGGKVGWTPPRYEAYVLALNLFGLGVVYREAIAGWCRRASWTRVGLFAVALLLVFSGYATQTLMTPLIARKEFLGPVQVHRFVTEFYRKPVAVDQLGYVNVANPVYVLDLSGLASESARLARDKGAAVEWMDEALASHGIALAIIDSGADRKVPERWVRLGALRLTHGGDAPNHVVFYARRPENATAIAPVLYRFAETLPRGVRLVAAKVPATGSALR